MPVTFVLTCIAMLAFAANSLLARAALAGGAIDAIGFTTIRLFSGGVALAALMLWQRGRAKQHDQRGLPGHWLSALCLFGYAMGFSLAYLRLSAATGALILFASVQAGMIGWGLLRGHRPVRAEAVGLALAFAGFVALVLPGLHAPDLVGSLLMIAAGLAWAAYSLRGRGSASPVGDTAGNFVRASAICLPVAALAMAGSHMTGLGILLALISGVVTSGMGYVLWYRALRGLTPVQAASVQLTVPLIAAIGAVLVLSEALTVRLVATGCIILAGVGLTVVTKRQP